MKNEKSGLDEAVSVSSNAAHVISGMVKTGKAVSGAAKGAAVGGPYGAVAGAVWGARKHINSGLRTTFPRPAVTTMRSSIPMPTIW